MLGNARRFITPLILPVILILTATFIHFKWDILTQKASRLLEFKAWMVVFPYLPILLFSIGVILGWRYHKSATTLISIVLAFSYYILIHKGISTPKTTLIGPTYPEMIFFLLPLNIALFAMLTRKRLWTLTGYMCLGLIAVESICVSAFCNPTWNKFISSHLSSPATVLRMYKNSSALIDAFLSHRKWMAGGLLPDATFIAFLTGFLFLAAYFFIRKNPLQAGFLTALISLLLSAIWFKDRHALIIFYSATGMIIVITCIEASYSAAYIDELTGIPGRRGLNELLVNLGKKYSIAMVDVDHFKKFNDTYGHDTGDQVLKRIASRLNTIKGGAKIFRYGGEEFTIVYPKKLTQQVIPYLEEYRKDIAQRPFFVRSKDRKQSNKKNRKPGKSSADKSVRITVSIGVSDSQKGSNDPQKVLKDADKALYRAKQGGRNQVAGN